MNKINKDEMELKTKAQMEEEKKKEMLKYQKDLHHRGLQMELQEKQYWRMDGEGGPANTSIVQLNPEDASKE